jgi:hypothetical protein
MLLFQEDDRASLAAYHILAVDRSSTPGSQGKEAAPMLFSALRRDIWLFDQASAWDAPIKVRLAETRSP